MLKKILKHNRISREALYLEIAGCTCASSSVPSFPLREESRAGRMTPR